MRCIRSLSKNDQDRLIPLIEARLGTAADTIETSIRLMKQLIKNGQLNRVLMGRMNDTVRMLESQKHTLLECARIFDSNRRSDPAAAILAESKYYLLTGNTIQGIIDDGKSLNQELRRITDSRNPTSLLERWEGTIRPLLVWNLAGNVTTGHLGELTLPKHIKKGGNAPPYTEHALVAAPVIGAAQFLPSLAANLPALRPAVKALTQVMGGIDSHPVALPRVLNLSERELDKGKAAFRKFIREAEYGYISPSRPKGSFNQPGELAEEQQQPAISNSGRSGSSGGAKKQTQNEPSPIQITAATQSPKGNQQYLLAIPVTLEDENGSPKEKVTIQITLPEEWTSAQRTLSAPTEVLYVYEMLVFGLSQLEGEKGNHLSRAFNILTRYSGIPASSLTKAFLEYIKTNPEAYGKALTSAETVLEHLHPEKLSAEARKQLTLLIGPLLTPLQSSQEQNTNEIGSRQKGILTRFLRLLENSEGSFEGWNPENLTFLTTITASAKLAIPDKLLDYVLGLESQLTPKRFSALLWSAASSVESWGRDRINTLLERLAESPHLEELPPEAVTFLLSLIYKGFEPDTRLVNFTLRRVLTRELFSSKNRESVVNALISRLAESESPLPEDLQEQILESKIRLDLNSCNYLANQLDTLKIEYLASVLKRIRLTEGIILEPEGVEFVKSDLLSRLSEGESARAPVAEALTELNRFKGVTLRFTGLELEKMAEHFSGSVKRNEIRLMLQSYSDSEVPPPLEFVDRVLKLDKNKFREERIKAVGLYAHSVGENGEISKRIDRIRAEYKGRLTSREKEMLSAANRVTTPAPPGLTTVEKQRPVQQEAEPSRPKQIFQTRTISPPADAATEVVERALQLSPADRPKAFKDTDEAIGKLRPTIPPALIVRILSLFANGAPQPAHSARFLLDSYLDQSLNPSSGELDSLAHSLHRLRIYHPRVAEFITRRISEDKDGLMNQPNNYLSLLKYTYEFSNSPPDILTETELLQLSERVNIRELGRFLQVLSRHHPDLCRKIIENTFTRDAKRLENLHYESVLSIHRVAEYLKVESPPAWQEQFDRALSERSRQPNDQPTSSETRVFNELTKLFGVRNVVRELDGASTYGYRVDFSVEAKIEGKPKGTVILELDGDEFHKVLDLSPPSDRQQRKMMYDIVRDELLERKGHKVIHVGWSEIDGIIRDKKLESLIHTFLLSPPQ